MGYEEGCCKPQKHGVTFQEAATVFGEALWLLRFKTRIIPTMKKGK
jgi:uncharacterized DUF497 family protein